MTIRRRIVTALVSLIVLFLVSGCQGIFTYSPLTFLQRPPSSLTPAARLTYAQDALASGDKDAMKSAYDAIKDDPGADASCTTAQLGIELSGVPTLLLQVATDASAVSTDLNDISGFIAEKGLDPAYLVDAAARLQAVDATVELTPMDYALGALGMLLGSAQATTGTWDITSPSVDTAPAVAFFTQAVGGAASLPDTDPLKAFITSFDAYLTGL
jgi:hypothetical protein